MENYIAAIVLVLIIIASLVWRASHNNQGISGDIDKSKKEFEKKDEVLKSIYVSMTEFDKIIVERDAAYEDGDMDMYFRKVKEANKCYEAAIKLSKN